MAKRRDYFDRIIERIDQLDAASMQGFLVKLVREKGLLETIFQTIREGVLILDHNLHIHYVNRAAMRLLGLPEDIRERRDPRIDLYLRDFDWQHLMASSDDDVEHASRQEIEIFYPEHRYLQFYVLPYSPPDAEAPATNPDLDLVAIVLRDITDLHHSTETTIESEKLKAIHLLAAGVAHEIGNPLNSLMIHLQLLDRTFRKDDLQTHRDEAADMLGVAMEEVRRLDTIINQFLRAVRPVPLDLHQLAVPQLISATLAVIKAEIENRGVTVECLWADDLPTIPGDETQLQQAFYNLIRNALQAMPDGGMLKIAVDTTDTTLDIHFADTGKGIAPADLGAIFTPYFTTRSEGTGLGLVIVERIIREHGGHLIVQSKVGCGTAFIIKLPLRIARTRLLDSPPPEPTP